jgi:hypothetical protein
MFQREEEQRGLYGVAAHGEHREPGTLALRRGERTAEGHKQREEHDGGHPEPNGQERVHGDAAIELMLAQDDDGAEAQSGQRDQGAAHRIRPGRGDLRPTGRQARSASA